MNIECITSIEELQARTAEWDDLARNAAGPNPFFEAWFMIPAFRNLSRQNGRFQAVLVYDRQRRLCGLFPMTERGRFRRMPLDNSVLWKHMHCYLADPLLRAGVQDETFAKFAEWYRSSGRRRLLAFECTSGSGPVYDALKGALELFGPSRIFEDLAQRAFFVREGTYGEYLSGQFGSKHRREYGRKSRKLATMGKVEYLQDEFRSGFDAWLREFLALEAGGWKGDEGTAMLACASCRSFFEEICRGALERERLFSFSLRLDGKLVAGVMGFTSPDGRGLYLFKLAIDEAFGKVSPGYLLELELVKNIYERNLFDWVDSCSEPESVISNRIWGTHPRKLAYSAAASRLFPEGFVLNAVLPLQKGIKRMIHGIA